MNARAQSRRFFPDWSRRQRAKWVLAKHRIAHRQTYPIGDLGVDREPPDFLRALPRHAPLTIVRTRADVVRDFRRLLRGIFA